jgi:hypothetical protein
VFADHRKPRRRDRSEREVVQPYWPIEKRRRIDSRYAAEPGDGGDLAEDVVADDGIGQRQHEEVDAERAARQCTEHQCDQRGDDERRHHCNPWIEPESQSLGTCLSDTVADDETGHAVREQLSERHHPAITDQEIETHREDRRNGDLAETVSTGIA